MNDSGSPIGDLTFDWKNPDYSEVLRQRQERLHALRSDPGMLAGVKDYYKEDHFVEFIRDWGMTRDPRVAADGRSPVFPFIPFPRQEELLHWFNDMLGNKERGNVDKTRDCGASWCALAFAYYRFFFFANNDLGFGSRKEELIDSKNDPKALFPKGRMFIKLLPAEFRPFGWNERRDAPYLKFINPENGSTIVGEAGDNIGRGGRTLIYFVDEHAFIERPFLAEGALSENTNTQINISTHNGPGTLFFKQCQALPESRIFAFDWFQDPRKDQAWYNKKKSDPNTDPIIFAQEIDRDPSRSIGDGFVNVQILDKAMKNGPADVIASGPFIVSVDVADLGHDASIINHRRGAVSFPQKKYPKTEADQLGAEVERFCDKLLGLGVASLGAIIYELEGPGYGLHAILKNGRYKEAIRPIHPGRKLASVEFYNERARFWQYALEWLEEEGKSMPNDMKLRIQASAMRYEWKINADGTRKLLIESKKDYRSRMAADPKNKMAGPSPDEADAWAIGFAPVRMANIIRPAPVGVLPDEFMVEHAGWRPLDGVVGY